MTDTDLEIIVFVLLAVAIGVYVCVSSSIKRKKAAENSIKKAWGKRAVYKGTDESFGYISHYAKGNPSESMIDDITWNDLGMDDIFRMMNNTNSSAGQEYLYRMLRQPDADMESLKKLDKLATAIDKNASKRLELQKIFVWIGRAKHISISDYWDVVVGLDKKSNALHYASLLFLVAAIVLRVL